MNYQNRLVNEREILHISKCSMPNLKATEEMRRDRKSQTPVNCDVVIRLILINR